VFRFRRIGTFQSGCDLRINNGFIRLLAAESVRFAADAPLALMLDEAGFSVSERYAPMQRLLAPDDELFLVGNGAPTSAKRLLREHRHCYFGYLRRLSREVRAARRLRTIAMASQEKWSFWILLAHVLLSESSLLYLRWLGCRHAMGIKVAARDVRECLDFLLVGPKFGLVTT
jgi:hypothetical protein